MTTEKCLFCDLDAECSERNSNRNTVVVCENCGKYEVTRSFKDDFPFMKYPHRHLISGLIREKTDLGLTPELITNDNFESLLNDSLLPKTIMQKLDRILLHFYRSSTTLGSLFPISFQQGRLFLRSIGYAKTDSEFLTMLRSLSELGYIKHSQENAHIFRLTLEGMKKSEELSLTNPSSKKVFVAMQFNQGIEDAHDNAIRPACEDCGYDSFLIKDVDHNNGITDEIIAQIKTSKFVIADFTYNNNGVYFEAGYAQGRGLEIIRTCKKDWFEKNGVHFDIKHYNLILWEDYADLRKQLVNRIQATIWK